MKQRPARGLADGLVCVIEAETQAMLQRYLARRAVTPGSVGLGAGAGRAKPGALCFVDAHRLRQEKPQ